MNPRKILALLVVFVAACVTPGRAQVFWSNQSPAGITDDVWCVTFGNGVFAATTNQGRELTSNDGNTWSSQVVDPDVWLVSIAYGNGTWVAVGAGGTILVSTDLKTWDNAASVTTNKLNGVLYTGSLWVAVGDSATVVTSSDALNWTVQTVPASAQVNGFLHGIVVVAPDNNQVLISGAMAGNGTGNVDTGVILSMPTTSGKGNQSYPISVFPTNAQPSNLEAIQLGPFGALVAVGWNGTILWYKPEYGYNLASGIPNVVFRGLAYGAGYWVAAGGMGTIMTSTDAQVWTQRFSGDSPSTVSTATLLSAAYSEPRQRFVVAGTGGTILVSNTAPTVFGNVSTRGYLNSTQTFIGGFVIEGTAPRTVLIRADGPVLSTFSVRSPLPDPVLTVYNSSGTVIATNASWATNTNSTSISTAALEVGAFALPNLNPDSALLLTLQPGAYTAQITSAKGNSGTALFEAYTD